VNPIEIQAGTLYPLALRLSQGGVAFPLTGREVRAVVLRDGVETVVAGSVTNAAEGRALIALSSALTATWEPGFGVQLRLQQRETGGEWQGLGIVPVRVV
jgi:hypothetical protein